MNKVEFIPFPYQKHHNRRQRKLPLLINREVVIFNIDHFTIDQSRGFGVVYCDVFDREMVLLSFVEIFCQTYSFRAIPTITFCLVG
jgi:hypothetical protein